MATSGTTTFTVNRDQVIDAVLRVLGVIGVGETPIQEDYTNCSQALNIMIKSWAKKGFPLWTYSEIVIPMIAGILKYPIGPSGAYVLSVSSTGGTGYTVGGTWVATNNTLGTPASGTYTVSGGKPLAFTVLVPGDSYTSSPTTFTLSGPGTTAVVTSIIIGLTIPKPLRVMTGFIRNASNIDTTITLLSREEYDQQGNKLSQAVVNQAYYDVKLINGQVSVFNVPSDSTYSLYLLTQRQFEDMNATANSFDFPQEWFQALKWGLCAELAEEYGVDENKIMRLEGKAQAYVMECFDWTQEEAPVYFTMDYKGSKK